MSEIPASLVKQLRDETGAGMMDCKRALEEAGGDLEAARRILRERGMAQAAKRAGRETSEGRVLIKTDDGAGAIVALGCETEPVSKNEEFLAFAERVLEAVAADGREAAEGLDEERKQLVGKLGENIVVVGAARFDSADGAVVEGYAHPPANKLGVLVQLRGGSQELARRVAMHIAASAPQWVSREDVPADLVTAERDIYASTDEVRSKPEQAREKIVEGMLNKRFFAAQVLTEQPWIHDPARAVGDVLAEEGAAVVAFERLTVA